MIPGAMPLTFTRCGPSSIASTLVNITTPAFEAQQCAAPLRPLLCAPDEIVMTFPGLFAATMRHAAAWHVKNTPRMFVSITRSHSTIEIPIAMPARSHIAQPVTGLASVSVLAF
jgi:hypothetical protein